MFIYFWERQRQSVRGGVAEREGDTEPETGSRLWTVSTEPDVGLELTNRDHDLSWSQTLNDWATQAPLGWENLKQAPCSVKSPIWGLTLGSWPEPKSKVCCSTYWATQVFHGILEFYLMMSYWIEYSPSCFFLQHCFAVNHIDRQKMSLFRN